MLAVLFNLALAVYLVFWIVPGRAVAGYEAELEGLQREVASLREALANAAEPSVGELHTVHCFGGCPRGAPETNDLIVREIYTLSSNDETKFADWVAYRVSRDTIGSGRDRVWRRDPWLEPEETLEPGAYRDANRLLGTDRGHQVPLASFTGTLYWQDTNVLSNITPQRSELNQGPWRELEEAVRELARGGDPVYVVTGPLYRRTMPKLPAATVEHQLPSGYFKIVIRQQANDIRLAGFILDQETERSADYCSGLTTVDEVERESGLDMFPRLDELEQGALESGVGALAEALGCG
ncbi:MAG: DNA/RNA non-specific endonuclease [Gemmatimonadota bacterium]|nr:MAG: DNA/RNA non-specific endonuclease [Gemmatimonadota bacterium]